MKPVYTNLESPPTPQPVETHTEMPVWLQRIFLVVYVVFCIELCVVLVALPWTALWTSNNLLVHWPEVRRFLAHGFVRGAISGLGLLDVWLGIAEAINYRERRR